MLKTRSFPVPPCSIRQAWGVKKRRHDESCFEKTKGKKRIEGGEQKKNIYTIQCHVFAKLSKTLPRRKRIIDFDFANFRFGTIQ